MKLDQWMTENRWGPTNFGEKVGASKAHISQVRHGKANPSKALIARISEFTNNQVTEADFNGGNDAERV